MMLLHEIWVTWVICPTWCQVMFALDAGYFWLTYLLFIATVFNLYCLLCQDIQTVQSQYQVRVSTASRCLFERVPAHHKGWAWPVVIPRIICMAMEWAGEHVKIQVSSWFYRQSQRRGRLNLHKQFWSPKKKIVLKKKRILLGIYFDSCIDKIQVHYKHPLLQVWLRPYDLRKWRLWIREAPKTTCNMWFACSSYSRPNILFLNLQQKRASPHQNAILRWDYIGKEGDWGWYVEISSLTHCGH